MPESASCGMAALRAGAGLVVDELLRPLCSYVRSYGGAPAAAVASSTTGAKATSSANGAEDWRFRIVRSVGEECQTDQELRNLLQRKADFIVYDGFEPSGRMHIAQGVFKAINVDKCTRAGGIFIFWVADWFALMNDKMGGDLDKIKTVGQYFIEVWKATGMDMSRVRFRWSSDDIAGSAEEYWGQALDIARRSTLARIKKCCQIMGRKEDSLTAAQIMYPIMQSTDIFFLKADICQLGVDQRKVNMLARDYCDSAGRKEKPVILSHHMVYGLCAGQAKMSKSNPDSAIFMEDTAEDIERKIRNAYCPTKPEADAVKAAEDEESMQLVKDDLMNPCLDYLQHILFSREGYTLTVGSKCYTTFPEARSAFLSGEISEDALKDRLIQEVNALIEPVRRHFDNDPIAKDLLAKITQWKKENLTAPPTLVRLQPQPSFSDSVFVIFAPLPSESVHLEVIFGVLRRLQQAPSDCQRIIWLEDWSASTLGCVGGSVACIRGYYELLLFGLRALAPALMEEVRVCWQGEMILSGPSEYWISVINAGRRCTLEDIRKHLPLGETLEYASQVFASLMHIGDVLSLTAASSVTLCCDKYHENLHHIAAEHCEACGLRAPEVKVVEGPALRLLAVGEGVEADVNIALTDKEVEVNKKIKKSFCMPQNVDFCPPLSWVAELLQYGGSEFTVFRKPDNGGDKNYTEVQSLREEFACGDLHPGDLKPSLSKAVNALLGQLQQGLQDDVLKRAIKDLEAYTKVQSKKK